MEEKLLKETIMGGCSMTMHIAAASLGLSSARCDCNQQEGYREVLGYPEPVMLYAIMCQSDTEIINLSSPRDYHLKI